MYIVVNGYPIDVYKIKKISSIQKISKETYTAILKGFVGYLGKEKQSLEELYVSYINTKEDDYRFYHTFLKYLDKVLQAVFDIRIYTSSIDPTLKQQCGMMYTAVQEETKLRRPDAISWDAVPDIYFFSLDYEDKRFLSGKNTTASQIFSEFYETKSAAEEARDELLNAINTVRCQTIKVEI